MSILNIYEPTFKYDRLTVDSTSSSLEKAINWFETLQKPFIPRQVWLECQTILGEAFDNVIVHAHKKLPKDTPIDIEVIISTKLIMLKIWDFGAGFNINRQKNKVFQGVKEDAENGRGIQILSQTADYINYINHDNRNYLLIIKMFVPLSTLTVGS